MRFSKAMWHFGKLGIGTAICVIRFWSRAAEDPPREWIEPGRELATGKLIKYRVEREHWSVHFNVSPALSSMRWRRGSAAPHRSASWRAARRGK